MGEAAQAFGQFGTGLVDPTGTMKRIQEQQAAQATLAQTQAQQQALSNLLAPQAQALGLNPAALSGIPAAQLVPALGQVQKGKQQQEQLQFEKEQEKQRAFEFKQKQKAQEKQLQEELGISRAKLGISEKQLALKQKEAESNLSLTPAQTAVDKAFSKDYVNFTAGGGSANIAKNLTTLENSVDELTKNPSLTGGVVGLTPLPARKLINPKSVALQQRVEAAVQENLKNVLGAQFTENEGKLFLARAYDSGLPASENILKLQQAANTLKQMASAKAQASKYFEENGTLRGYKGPTVQSVLETFKGPAGTAAADLASAQEWLKNNPNHTKAAGVAARIQQLQQQGQP